MNECNAIIARDILKRFRNGDSVIEVRGVYPRVEWGAVTDLFFEVVSERQVEYTARLSTQLDEISQARGLPRSVVARQALETLATHRLIGRAVDGHIFRRAVKPPLTPADGIPRFIGAHP